MSPREAPTRVESLLAYGISTLTTLLWVACVLPAGELAAPGATGDDAVPIHRQALLIVPALLLLIAAPVGSTLARRERGMRAVLATTDAFVCVYVALALWTTGAVRGATTGVAVLLLLLVGTLSLAEAWRASRPKDQRPSTPAVLSGSRLAICMLVLVMPLYVLLQPEVERASLLAPFLFVAVSAGGARLARDMRGLHRTGALVQLLLGVHLLISLRYTIHATGPELTSVLPTGQVALALAGAVVLVALLQVVVYLGPGRQAAGAAAAAGSA